MTDQDSISLEVRREIIMDMIYEVCSDLLPEDDKGLPPAVEHKIEEIYLLISRAMGIEPDDAI